MLELGLAKVAVLEVLSLFQPEDAKVVKDLGVDDVGLAAEELFLGLGLGTELVPLLYF